MTQNTEAKRPRDPEDRRIDQNSEQEKRERALDKTLADSFPTSDPPSTIPDPGESGGRDVKDKTD